MEDARGGQRAGNGLVADGGSSRSRPIPDRGGRRDEVGLTNDRAPRRVLKGLVDQQIRKGWGDGEGCCRENESQGWKCFHGIIRLDLFMLIP